MAEPVGPVLTRPGDHRPVLSALRRRRRLRQGLIQLVYVGVATGLAMLLPRLDVGPSLGSDLVASMLFAVGGSMVTFTGLVFSLLFLVVQWGTSTFTPRLNLFRDDPFVWHAFGFFVGVLMFCLVGGLVSTTVSEVPTLVAVVALGAIVVSLALFRRLQLSAFRSIQLAATLDDVVARGRTVFDALYRVPISATASPARLDLPAKRAEVLWRRRAGVLLQIDLPRLVERAHQCGAVVVLDRAVGEVVYEDTPLAHIHGGHMTDEVVLTCVEVGPERTFDQDPLLALRILVDIGLRALSPAINDPTTAVQVIDSLEALLARIIGCELRIGNVADDAGSLRVVVPLPTWQDYVELAFDELALAATGSPAVLRRLERCLARLADMAPASRRQDVRQHLLWVRAQLDGRRPILDQQAATDDVAGD